MSDACSCWLCALSVFWKQSTSILIPTTAHHNRRNLFQAIHRYLRHIWTMRCVKNTRCWSSGMNRRLDSLELNRLEGMLQLVISLCSLIVMWESCLQDRHECLLAKEIFCQECSGFSTHVILHTCHFCWFKTCCQRCFSRFSAAPANRLWGPQPNWHVDFLQLIGENYRRMVIPQITGLDIDTWTQIGSGGGMSKCYLTWDGDFKWGGACQLKFRLTGDVVFFYLFFFFGERFEVLRPPADLFYIVHDAASNIDLYLYRFHCYWSLWFGKCWLHIWNLIPRHWWHVHGHVVWWLSRLVSILVAWEWRIWFKDDGLGWWEHRSGRSDVGLWRGDCSCPSFPSGSHVENAFGKDQCTLQTRWRYTLQSCESYQSLAPRV